MLRWLTFRTASIVILTRIVNCIILTLSSYFSVYSSNLCLFQYLKQPNTNKNGIAKVLGLGWNKYSMMTEYTKYCNRKSKMTLLRRYPISCIGGVTFKLLLSIQQKYTIILGLHLPRRLPYLCYVTFRICIASPFVSVLRHISYMWYVTFRICAMLHFVSVIRHLLYMCYVTFRIFDTSSFVIAERDILYLCYVTFCVGATSSFVSVLHHLSCRCSVTFRIHFSFLARAFPNTSCSLP